VKPKGKKKGIQVEETWQKRGVYVKESGKGETEG